MDKSSEAIGVFDSGAGGLTVVRRLLERMPNEKIIYFGDTARVPYGCRPPEVITHFSLENCDFLVSKKVKAIVVACNTVTVTCLSVLQEKYDVPIFGIVEPAINALAQLKEQANHLKIGVIGTERTIESGVYLDLLRERLPNADIYQKPCQRLVSLVEHCDISGEAAKHEVSEHLLELKDKKIDALLLGCTHFPLLSGIIGDLLGGGVMLIDPAHMLSAELERYLLQNKLNNRDSSKKPPAFFVSGDSDSFSDILFAALQERHPVHKSDF